MTAKSADKKLARLLQELAEERSGHPVSYVRCLTVARANLQRRDGETREAHAVRVFDENREGLR